MRIGVQISAVERPEKELPLPSHAASGGGVLAGPGTLRRGGTLGRSDTLGRSRRAGGGRRLSRGGAVGGHWAGKTANGTAAQEALTEKEPENSCDAPQDRDDGDYGSHPCPVRDGVRILCTAIDQGDLDIKVFGGLAAEATRHIRTATTTVTGRRSAQEGNREIEGHRAVTVSAAWERIRTRRARPTCLVSDSVTAQQEVCRLPFRRCLKAERRLVPQPARA
jgi:hypothetical protein